VSVSGFCFCVNSSESLEVSFSRSSFPRSPSVPFPRSRGLTLGDDSLREDRVFSARVSENGVSTRGGLSPAKKKKKKKKQKKS
jgi:hypothetical protein